MARARHKQKRGGDAHHFALDEARTVAEEPCIDLVALDEALTAMEAVDQRKARVVELRFFGGMNVEETAEVLKISTDTVSRDWVAARAWLYRELRRERSHGA
jgi:RNA polymerase sigma factor (TIGR02999 family)